MLTTITVLVSVWLGLIVLGVMIEMEDGGLTHLQVAYTIFAMPMCILYLCGVVGLWFPAIIGALHTLMYFYLAVKVKRPEYFFILCVFGVMAGFAIALSV